MTEPLARQDDVRVDVRVDATDGRDSVTGLGPCAGCGHDPACGFSSIWNEEHGERWLCHTDDHSCFVGRG